MSVAVRVLTVDTSCHGLKCLTVFPLKSFCLLCMLAAALLLRHHFSASASRNTARVAPQSSTHHRDPPVPSHSVACRYCWLHVTMTARDTEHAPPHCDHQPSRSKTQILPEGQDFTPRTASPGVQHQRVRGQRVHPCGHSQKLRHS